MKEFIQFLIKKSLFVLFMIFYLLNCNLLFAQSSQDTNKFVVGTFIASSGAPENQKYTHYNNYSQILDLGVNAIWQLAIKDIPSLNQTSNYDSLCLFDFIWASNDSGTGTVDEENINAEPENIDWISYFTSAKYMKWEAEGDPLFEGSVRIKHEDALGTFGSPYTDGGVSGWRSGNDPENRNRFLITGPDYWQYPRYTFTNTSWNPEPIRYQAVFHIKMSSPSTTNVPVCSLFVVMTDSAGVEHTLDSLLVTSSMLSSTDYLDIALPYNYIGFFNVDSVNKKSYSMPGTFGIQSPPGYNIYSRTEFRVQWLGNKEIFVDYIETYDQMIWERFFLQHPERVVDSIITYDQDFANQNPAFYDKLKYYFTMDEPHSLDGYEPLRRVQEILDNNNIQADLLTHWYPEWDGLRDGGLSFPVYKALAQPKKLMFWYAPFTNNKYTLVPDNRDFTLYFLHNQLQQAYILDNLYFLSAQTFGRKVGDNYEQWMLPDTSEVLAETMLALAHGCKGIFFENYYSYTYNEGLVEEPTAEHHYPPRPIWHTVKKIASRLNGTLGKTLVSLNYSGTALDNGFLRLYPYASIEDMEDKITGTTVTKDYLTLSLYNNQPTPQIVNFHTGFYSYPSQVGNNYFFLTNQSTTLQRAVNISITDNQCTNMRFRNIEPEYNFDITFTGQTTQTLNFPAGEGYLFQVAPVAKYGGKLVYNETVIEGTTLYDDMTIENGATLTVNGTYTANANITVKTGGKIKYGNNNSKIVFNNGAKLMIEGNAQVYGTLSTNKLTLDFSSSSSEGVLVKTGAVLTMSYCNVNNAGVGIKAEIGSSVNIVSSNFTNIPNPSYGKGVFLFDFEADASSILPTPIIQNCNFTGYSIAITALNFPEVVIQGNTINQSYTGIFVYGASSAYISSNSILGSQTINNNYGDGILMLNCGGYLRNNTIKYFQQGIEFANSSPDLGVNTIEQNYKCGLNISSGSYPNLVQQLANPNCWYPIGGCNVIRNNGNYTQLPPLIPQTVPDGAEIFLNSGDALLSYGYNEISDDRTDLPEYLTLPLIKGTRSRGGAKEFFVDHNYWGVVGPSLLRFGTLEVDYDPAADYCPLPDAPCSGSELIIQTTDGQIIDTLDSRARESTDISALEETYSTADKLYYNGAVEESKTYYQMIVEGNYTNEEKLYAYNKLYEIGNLLKEDDNYFSALQNAFNSIITVETDTLLLKAFNQKSILCDVSRKEYLTAISKFDNIIQQNPNSEEAVYAEIDIITTALNLDTTNSQLGKMGGGKYLVKGTSDYLTKLNNLLQNKFGINTEEKEQTIPKEYSLYQNYPNPFNPTTTIKYDIPDVGTGLALAVVTLKVYDILGRDVATLVNEYKTAGSYEQVFNASSLASGVYVYKLQAGDFVSSKKMMLLK